jgi:SAM-dependent methyltransferase
MKAATCAIPSAVSGDESATFAALFAAEERHFWFRARNRVIGEVLRSLTSPLPDGYRVLEVGCGNGNVLRVLEQICARGKIIGLDRFAERLHYARQRVHCPLVQADLHHWPFRTPFDVIGMFDVLEHLADDRLVLRQLHRALRPGGYLVLTVPAHQKLWSYSDVVAQHYRRYAPWELKQILADAGFDVEYLTQFMMALYPLMWLGRRSAAGVPLREAGSPDWARFRRELRVVPGVNGLLTWLLEREARWIARRWRLPLGTSLLAIARKPNGIVQRG